MNGGGGGAASAALESTPAQRLLRERPFNYDRRPSGIMIDVTIVRPKCNGAAAGFDPAIILALSPSRWRRERLRQTATRLHYVATTARDPSVGIATGVIISDPAQKKL